MTTLSQQLIDKAASVVQQWAMEATYAMKENLKRHGIDERSNLSQSINFDGTQITPTGVSVEWELPGYAVYVDMGVRGLQNTAKVYGTFAFKNLHVSRGFLSNIEDWITRKGIKARFNRQESQKTVFDRRKTIAFAIAKSIKKKGLDGTQFYSDVFNEKGFKKLTDALEKQIGDEFQVRVISTIVP